MANFAMAGAIHVVADTPMSVANMFNKPSGVGLFSPQSQSFETYYFGMFPHTFSDGYSAEYEAISGNYRSEPMTYQWKGGDWSRFTLDLFVSNGVDGDPDLDPNRSPDTLHHDVIRSAQEGVSTLDAFRQNQIDAVQRRTAFVQPGTSRETDVNKAFPSVKDKVLWLQSLALPSRRNPRGGGVDGGFVSSIYSNMTAAYGGDAQDEQSQQSVPDRVVITAGSWLLKTGYIESVEITYLAPFDCEEYVAYDSGAIFTMGTTYEPLYAEVRLTLIQHGKYWYAKDTSGPTRTDVLRMGIS